MEVSPLPPLGGNSYRTAAQGISLVLASAIAYEISGK